MGGYHPGTLSDQDRAAANMRQLLNRIRRLEARLNVSPLVAVPAAGVTVTSTTLVPMWTLLDVSPAQWTVTVVVAASLSSPSASSQLMLYDAAGKRVDSAAVVSGQLVTLSGTGHSGPFTVQGACSAGSLTTKMVSVVASPWSPSDG